MRRRQDTNKEIGKGFSNKIGTAIHVLENGTQWYCQAEFYIGLIKESTRKDTCEAHSPIVLWDYAMELHVIIHQVASKDLLQLNNANPHTATFGTKADILKICQS